MYSTIFTATVFIAVQTTALAHSYGPYYSCYSLYQTMALPTAGFFRVCTIPRPGHPLSAARVLNVCDIARPGHPLSAARVLNVLC
jgi:hypothetical protein